MRRSSSTPRVRRTTRGTISAGNAFVASASESDVQKSIMDWVNLMPGFRLWRRNLGALKAEHNGKKYFVRFGVTGMADLEGIGPGGLHIEIEVKRPGKKPTDEQKAWLQQCRDQGAIAFWADNLDSAVDQMNDALCARGVRK
jgi:hypothetical protein